MSKRSTKSDDVVEALIQFRDKAFKNHNKSLINQLVMRSGISRSTIWRVSKGANCTIRVIDAIQKALDELTKEEIYTLKD